MDARQRLGLASELFVVGCLARLNLDKGIDDVIEALSQVPDPDGRMRLVVTGDGNARAARAPGRGEAGLARALHRPA